MTLIEAAYDLLDEKLCTPAAEKNPRRYAQEVVDEIGDGRLTFHINEEGDIVFDD